MSKLQIVTIDKETWRKLKHVTFGIAYAIFAFWMLLNGESFLGYWEDYWTWSILFYLAGVAVFLSVVEKLPEDVKSDNVDNILGFLIGFPLFTGIFILMADSGLWFRDLTSLPSYMIIPTIIYQVGIVATSEEIIFRGVLFTAFYRVHRYVAYFVSSILFALFHYSAYDASVGLIFVAFVMGMILCYLTEKVSLGCAVAFHGAYNCFVIGATYLMIVFFL